MSPSGDRHHTVQYRAQRCESLVEIASLLLLFGGLGLLRHSHLHLHHLIIIVTSTHIISSQINLIYRHTMSRRVTSYHVMSCRVVSCHVMSRRVMSHHVMSPARLYPPSSDAAQYNMKLLFDATGDELTPTLTSLTPTLTSLTLTRTST